jgi:ATP-dependent Lon protease
VLFNTLLDGAENVDEGLVQKDSPFVGTRKFGMCFVTRDGRMASIGTTLEIQQHVTESDGRLYVTQKVGEPCERRKTNASKQ